LAKGPYCENNKQNILAILQKCGVKTVEDRDNHERISKDKNNLFVLILSR
jgi:hypothetical protein